MKAYQSVENRSVLCTLEEGVATIALNLPQKLNAVNLQIIGDITGLLGELEREEAVGCIVIRAAGTPGRIPYAGDMAGADLTELRRCESNFEYREYYRQFTQYFAKIRSVDRPVVGVLNGYAFGAGMGLAASADLVVATEGSTFGMLEINYGFPGGAGILTKMLGRHKAAEVLFLGRRFDAHEAYRIGLVNRVVAEARLEGEVLSITRRICGQSLRAVAMAKRLINAALDSGVDEACGLELEAASLCLNTPEARSRIEAFLSK